MASPWWLAWLYPQHWTGTCLLHFLFSAPCRIHLQPGSDSVVDCQVIHERPDRWLAFLFFFILDFMLDPLQFGSADFVSMFMSTVIFFLRMHVSWARLVHSSPACFYWHLRLAPVWCCGSSPPFDSLNNVLRTVTVSPVSCHHSILGSLSWSSLTKSGCSCANISTDSSGHIFSDITYSRTCR